MQDNESHGPIAAMDRRAGDKFTIDRTINVGTLGAGLMALVAAVSMLNNIQNTVEREREARIKLETSFAEQRIEASRMRVELQQQIGNGLDKIENKLDRGMSELRSDIKSVTTNK